MKDPTLSHTPHWQGADTHPRRLLYAEYRLTVSCATALRYCPALKSAQPALRKCHFEMRASVQSQHLQSRPLVLNLVLMPLPWYGPFSCHVGRVNAVDKYGDRWEQMRTHKFEDKNWTEYVFCVDSCLALIARQDESTTCSRSKLSRHSSVQAKPRFARAVLCKQKEQKLVQNYFVFLKKYFPWQFWRVLKQA